MKITKSQLKRIIKEATEEYAATAEEEAKKSHQDAPWRAELQPLAWTSLKLPFSEELMAEVAE